MKLRILLAALLIAMICGWSGWRLAWFIAEDACMDHGGRWQSAGSYCHTGAPENLETSASTR